LLNSDFPLSALYTDRNILKKLVEDQGRDPKVTLVGRTAILHSTAVQLKDIGNMYRSLLKDISEVERQITRGLSDTDDRLQLRLPDLPSDESNNTSVEFFFAEIPRNGFVGAGDVMLDIIINHDLLRGQYIVDTGGDNLSFNPVACHELLQQFANLRALLFSAAHISSGSPGRGTEIASQHLRNAPGGDVRNVKLIGGKICFVGGYNKTTHQVRDASCADSRRRSLITRACRPKGTRSCIAPPPDDLAPGVADL